MSGFPTADTRTKLFNIHTMHSILGEAATDRYYMYIETNRIG